MVRTNEQKRQLFKTAHKRAKTLQTCKEGRTYAEALQMALKSGHDSSKAKDSAGYSSSFNRIVWEDSKPEVSNREYDENDFAML